MFLAAIAADPRDQTVRLVFADWLDDHDEYIEAARLRAQVAAEHAPVTSTSPTPPEPVPHPGGDTFRSRIAWLRSTGEPMRLWTANHLESELDRTHGKGRW